MDDREHKIREHAYRIWEEEGRPEGSHEDHWRQAEEHHSTSKSGEAAETSEENWKAEAGLSDDKPAGISPTLVTPD